MLIDVLCRGFIFVAYRFVFGRLGSFFFAFKRFLAVVVACIFPVRGRFVDLAGVILELCELVVSISDHTTNQCQLDQGLP